MPTHVPYIHLRAPAVLPSLLMCDFGHLADEIARCEDAGAPGLHLDVMDGHFVPNLSYGLPLVETVRRLTRLPLETHLMITQPEQYVGRYIDAGADVVTFHVEAAADPRAVLAEVRKRGAKAGLAFNPPTPLAAVEPYLDDCDLVLVMSVHPGFGGQEFEPAALEKLRCLRARAGLRAALEIDGGVNEHTISAAAEAGAHVFVVGSAIFHSRDYRATIFHLADLAKTHVTT